MSNEQVARQFVDAIDGARGAAFCAQFCHDGATFSCQTDGLADVKSVAGYAEWVVGLAGPMPGNHCEIKAFAFDEERGRAVAFCVFHATNTGEGGPVPPTGKTAASDYVYVMDFDGDRIQHMTKIWNDVAAFKMLGWM